LHKTRQGLCKGSEKHKQKIIKTVNFICGTLCCSTRRVLRNIQGRLTCLYVWVHSLKKNIGATSKLYATEGWTEVTSSAKTPKYKAISLKIKLPTPLGAWVYGQHLHISTKTIFRTTNSDNSTLEQINSQRNTLTL
jgi:hypothetical protein